MDIALAIQQFVHVLFTMLPIALFVVFILVVGILGMQDYLRKRAQLRDRVWRNL